MHYQLRIESIHQHCYLKAFLLPIRNAKKKKSQKEVVLRTVLVGLVLLFQIINFKHYLLLSFDNNLKMALR